MLKEKAIIYRVARGIMLHERIRDSLLGIGSIYDIFQSAIGGYALKRRLLTDVIGEGSTLDILDVGCGTGIAATWAHGCSYDGIDYDPGYVERAKARRLQHARFFVGRAQEAVALTGGRKYDLVLMFGLMHHLPLADCTDLLAELANSLNPGGQLVGMEPAYSEGQSWLTQATTALDRGTNILTDIAWNQLLLSSFDVIESHVDNAALRLPYGLFVYRCSLSRAIV